YLALAFDLRGHGKSTGADGALGYRAVTDWHAALAGIDAAKAALIEAGAAAETIAVIGAELGANLALHAAAQDSQLAAAVLVSPGLEYHGIATAPALDRLGAKPLLLITAEQDSYSAMSATALKQQTATFSELRTY